MWILEWRVLGLRVAAEFLRLSGHSGESRVIEFHPAGGQSYALAVMLEDSNGVFDRRLTVKLNELVLPEVDKRISIRSPKEKLRPLREIVTELQAVLPIKNRSSIQNINPIIESLMLIADIQESVIDYRMEREVLFGWHDSSGIEGSFVHASIWYDERFNPGGMWDELPWEKEMIEAGKYWFLEPTSIGGDVSVVVSTSGEVWLGAACEPLELSKLGYGYLKEAVLQFINKE